MKWRYVELSDAVRIIAGSTPGMRRVEECAIDSSDGRILAENISAGFDVPPWDRSTVDGYAVRSIDTVNVSDGIELRCIGEIGAGQFFAARIGRGDCVRIATGSPVPDGADAVVMQEDVTEEGHKIILHRGVRSGQNISRKGVDIRKGDMIAEKGSMITPGAIGAIASQGIGSVRVFRRPDVAVIPGGDEIAETGGKAGPGQIFDVNSHVVSAIVRQAGGIPHIHRPIRDTYSDVRSALRWGNRMDICVFVSGSSVGRRDYVKRAVEEIGRPLFHGVRIRPGRPSLFATVKGRPVFGLPGNPVSSFVSAHLLLRQCIGAMTGYPRRFASRVVKKYDGSEKADDEFTRIVTVKVIGEKAIPVFKESGAITGVSKADGFVMLEKGKSLRRGMKVDVELF